MNEDILKSLCDVSVLGYLRLKKLDLLNDVLDLNRNERGLSRSVIFEHEHDLNTKIGLLDNMIEEVSGK